jgi:hypothetical protein
MLPVPVGFQSSLDIQWTIDEPKYSNLALDLANGGAGTALVNQFLATDRARDIQQLRDQSNRRAVNPQIAAFFKNTSNRRLSFDWALTARSSSDSETIRDIKRTFLSGALPSVADGSGSEGGRLLAYPDAWEVQFFNAAIGGENTFYEIYYQVIISNVSVSYNSSLPSPVEFVDGAPVEVQLSLQMDEIKSLTREDV